MSNWKRKLTSRKFWVSIASFVTMLLIFFGKTESEAAQVAALIMAGATVIGYVIGEGLADSSNTTTTTTTNIYSDTDPGAKDGEV